MAAYAPYHAPTLIGSYDVFAEFEVFGKKGSGVTLREKMGTLEMVPNLSDLAIRPVGVEVNPTVRELNPQCFLSQGHSAKGSREKLGYPVTLLISLFDMYGNPVTQNYCPGVTLVIQIRSQENERDVVPHFKSCDAPSITLPLVSPDPSHPDCLCFSANNRVLDLDVDHGDYGTFEISLTLSFLTPSLPSSPPLPPPSSLPLTPRPMEVLICVHTQSF